MVCFEIYLSIVAVCTAWETSFACHQTNLKAVTEYGWGPLNYNCLKHPELQLMKTITRDPTNNQPPSAAVMPIVAPHQLNLNNGFA